MASEGVIVRRNNKDYRVNTLTLNQFKEIYRIRNLTEIYVARRACKMQPSTAEHELKSIYSEMKKGADNVKKYIFYNQQFHFHIYSYGKMPMLQNIISSLWTRVGPYLSIHMEMLEDLTNSIENHSKILRHFVKKNEEQFASYLKEDFKQSYQSLTPLVKKLQMDEQADFRKFILSKVFEKP